VSAKTARIARVLLLLCLGVAATGCTFLANEFAVLDRAAPAQLPATPSATWLPN
jgi:hypothetical protein